MHEARFGDNDGFHIDVQKDYSAEEPTFTIIIWPNNHGVTITIPIRSLEVATALAKHLYDVLLPEFLAGKERQEEWYRKFEAEMAARPKPKPLRIPKNAPKVEVLVCPDCNALIPPDEVSDERVYECQNCSTAGAGEDARRCEQCNKFTAKVSDTSCPQCGAAMDDAEKVQAQRATTGALVQAA